MFLFIVLPPPESFILVPDSCFTSLPWFIIPALFFSKMNLFQINDMLFDNDENTLI